VAIYWICSAVMTISFILSGIYSAPSGEPYGSQNEWDYYGSIT